MEILQTLINLLSNGLNSNSPLAELVKNLDLSGLTKILGNLFTNEQQKSPTESVGQGYSLNPIINIADKDIIYTLNKYYSAD